MTVDVFKPDPDIWNGPYFGADWGFAKDPTTLVRFWIAPNEEGWDLMIEYEAYGNGVDINDLPELFEKIPDSRKYIIRADCSRPETINYLANQGFNIIPAPKWSGSVEDGIAWLRGCDKIIIHDRCKHAIEEARNYSFKVDRLTGDILPLVQKGFDHIWDAVRYGASPMIIAEDEEDVIVYYDPVRISPF
jgi:phage terminase large subunit